MKPNNEHPLVGTWITDEEDSDGAFVIKAARGRFVVSGFCRSDGEKFKIAKTQWDGKSLCFESFMPSTGWKAGHVFRMRADGKIEHELTTWEIWKKKAVKPGELPKAWLPKIKKLPTPPRTGSKG